MCLSRYPCVHSHAAQAFHAFDVLTFWKRICVVALSGLISKPIIKEIKGHKLLERIGRMRLA